VLSHVAAHDAVAQPCAHIAGAGFYPVGYILQAYSVGAVGDIGLGAVGVFVVKEPLVDEEIVDNSFVCGAPVELEIGETKQYGVGGIGQNFMQEVLFLAALYHHIKEGAVATVKRMHGAIHSAKHINR